MDKQSQDKFDEIVLKSPDSLMGTEIDFLRARRSYLSTEETKKFEGVLKVEEETVDYSTLKKDALVALVSERNIEVPETAKTKADYVSLLEEADKKVEEETV